MTPYLISLRVNLLTLCCRIEDPCKVFLYPNLYLKSFNLTANMHPGGNSGGPNGEGGNNIHEIH